MINHEKLKELLSAYVDNELNVTEKSLVEDHLLTCQECQSTYKEYQKLKITLNQWTDENLSLDVDTKINKALSEKNIRRDPMKPKNNVFRIGVGSSLIVVLLFTLILSQTYFKSGVQGRLKQAADDIGDHFSPNHALQARVREASTYLAKNTQPLSSTLQYEPYYLNSSYEVKDKLGSLSASSTLSHQSFDQFAKADAPKLANSSLIQGGFARMEVNRNSPRQNGFTSVSFNQKIMDEGWGQESFGIMSPISPAAEEFNTENYSRIVENDYLTVQENPLSTFSIDVDTASYSNIRRFLNYNQMPPEDAVRIEEMINYFTYSYPKPEGNKPFSITTNIAQAPWNKSHKLIRVGLQGKSFENDKIPPSNLVFLIDSSGSMNDSNKMPLLKSSFLKLTQQLRPEDHVAIVTYAGAAGLVLDSTEGSNKYKIEQAINNLYAGGSTAGGAGIKLAYEVAKNHFIKNGNNRVILATDGDFNVGVSSDAELVRLIEDKRKDGVFLTVLGFGTGNYKDNKMEQLADKGNGNFYYIDNENEAKKVLVSELGSTIFTIAKDVKIQIEFNPSQVKAYRLIGYENRILKKEDFNDDTKDAGELGAGHTVTALYEIVPADSLEIFSKVDELKYQKQERVNNSNEVMTVKLRYKDPDKDTSELITTTVNKGEEIELKDDFAFASSVAEFGLLLRNSKFKADASYDQVLSRANASIGKDTYGYRQEFISLVQKAKQIDQRPANPGVINFKSE